MCSDSVFTVLLILWLVVFAFYLFLGAIYVLVWIP